MGLYTPGQVARMLGTGSSHRIRRLCESGWLTAELTENNRWQIPDSEAERLREYVGREGDLPPVPRMEPVTTNRRVNAEQEQLAGESDDPEDSEDESPDSPAVRAEADSLAVAEKRLKRRRLELGIEQIEDAFRERESRMLAELEEKQRVEAKEQARQSRKKWLDSWERWGLSLVPSGMPADCRLSVHREIQRALSDLRADQSEEITRDLVRAAVAKTVGPHQQRQELRESMRKAVDSAMRELPYDTPEEFRAKARQAGNDAVLETAGKSGDLVSAHDLLVTAKAAIQPVAAAGARQAHDRQVERWKQEIIQGCWPYLLHANDTEREKAEQAVRDAFQGVSGTEITRATLERIRDRALDPIRTRIEGRKEKEAASARAAATTDRNLYHVDSYLSDNFADCFESLPDRWQTAREFRADLRPLIVDRLVKNKLTAADVEAFIEEWIDEEMEDSDDDSDFDD
jgi:hypothetical protein